MFVRHETDGLIKDRRSPVGRLLLGALSLRGDEAMAFSELLRIADDSAVTLSTVLVWAAQAEESGLIEQVPYQDGEGRALRLTGAGIEIARNGRRRADHRRRWDQLPENFFGNGRLRR